VKVVTVNMSSDFDVESARARFPALQQKLGGSQVVYLDGPGGTQVPQSVIDAISSALSQGISNLGGAFLTSSRAEDMVLESRKAMADFLGASRPEEIVFGQNMTSLNFALSRALCDQWGEGDEIVLTRIDHDANISPWTRAAASRGIKIRWIPFRRSNGTLDLTDLGAIINEKTKLVAVTYASNALGSISPLPEIIAAARKVGALVSVDAVHYGPHRFIDVQALDCDFLLCSAYKFFGPHIGIMYGKYEHLDSFPSFKLRPAYDQPPEKWETGTQSIECLCGVQAAVDYIASYSDRDTSVSRREHIMSGMAILAAYEKELGAYFLKEALLIEGLTIYGVSDVNQLDIRTPTFALDVASKSAAEVELAMGERGIFVWSGHYYAMTVMEDLGLLESGGLVRVGFVHYNTREEADRVLEALRELSRA
jgi:cysteine desulfurase family protein (TIGR01976 family)